MHPWWPGSDQEGSGTVFRDVITMTLLGFIAIVIMLLPHINEPESKKKEDQEPPGNVIVELFWDNGIDADIDLWIQAPGDVPVGYSNLGTLFFNLLRDDLGLYNDATNLNYEIAYSRGIPGGEYTVNVHSYRVSNKKDLPIAVKVVVSVRKPDVGRSGNKAPITKQILTTTANLVKEGQELTIFRYDLDDKGELKPETVHNVHKPLRANP